MLKSMTFPERLRAAREAAKLTQEQLGERLKVTQSTIQQWETGETMPRPARNLSIAKALGVDVVWLFQGRKLVETVNNKTVPLVGYVGAGAQIFPVDDHLKGASLERVEAPPIGNAHGIVAVRVRGESMIPAYYDGNVIYYGEHEADPMNAVGEEVVVCTDDGNIFVKRLARGRSPGCFDLISYNGAILQDQRIQWVALILWVRKSSRRSIVPM